MQNILSDCDKYSISDLNDDEYNSVNLITSKKHKISLSEYLHADYNCLAYCRNKFSIQEFARVISSKLLLLFHLGFYKTL